MLDKPCLCKIVTDVDSCHSGICEFTGRVGLSLQKELLRMTGQALFAFASRSKSDHTIVCRFLQDQPSQNIRALPGAKTGILARLPVELIEDIILNLPMSTRIWIAATCRVLRAIANRALLTAAARSLRPFKLSLLDLRFLQSCTATFVSGAVLQTLLYDAVERGADDPGIQELRPPTLDLYCPVYAGLDVAEFVAYSTGYRRDVFATTVDVDGIIEDCHILTRSGHPSIRVFETASHNPLDAIFHFPTTADMGAWFLDRIWHANPKVTFHGLAITTPERLPLYNLDTRQRAWDVTRSAATRGFKLIAEWTREHSCSRSYSCPLTWRTARDSGCLNLTFPTLPYSARGMENVWRNGLDVCWSMGGIVPCTKKSTENKVKRIFRSYRHHEHRCWMSAMLEITNSKTRPFLGQ
ncbi:hypothetical protein B0H16DRAFT_1469468 [Mycena metata]|uniref:F-box domain-containing protein n=1 Tax=Mycena metata TaxID=1033252 RepID=A0AAD7MT45_9AGAR|nr:hypothetical protein B0H16DRAFT_1469468 [Mycena metata]